jgi:glycosyltransferase involved in cell wall biosynthesis
MELEWFLEASVDARAIRRDLGIPEHALVVGKIARLFPLKGHEQLLEALPDIVRAEPRVRFLLVGDGVLQDKLKTRAAALGVSDRLVFTGLVPRERIPEMIAAMDVLVHTSLREGLARALPQALAMGKPCVSYSLDGAPEVVVDGETGFLVRPGDTGGLVKALMTLLEDEALRRQMGERGRQLVSSRFPADRMVTDTAAIYHELLQRKLGYRSLASSQVP